VNIPEGTTGGGRGSVVAFGLLAVLLAGPGAGAQLPPPRPDPWAFSIGTALVLPSGNLALQDYEDGRYARRGTALTQRLGWSPLPWLACFLQGSFPVFGLDAGAAQRDGGLDPPITGGETQIVVWNLGLRWHLRPGWLSGPYAETAAGWHRARLELEFGDGTTEGEAYEWRPGGSVAVGWVVGLGPALGLDVGVTLHEFKEDYFVDRWFAFRALATFSFGGDR
jgi:hypothetical protein